MNARRFSRRLVAAVVAALAAAPAYAGARALPVPAQVIYPGEKISGAMLVDAPAPPPGETPFDTVWSRVDLVGKAARRTLLPGRPITSFAVEEPRAVSVGEQVRLVYQQGELSIVTTAQALQNGFIGQVVQVRNLDSGVVVAGAIQPDGSVRVSGG